jgi:hypothetical protein
MGGRGGGRELVGGCVFLPLCFFVLPRLKTEGGRKTAPRAPFCRVPRKARATTRRGEGCFARRTCDGRATRARRREPWSVTARSVLTWSLLGRTGETTKGAFFLPLFFSLHAVFTAKRLHALARVAERNDSARLGRLPQGDRGCVGRDLTVSLSFSRARCRRCCRCSHLLWPVCLWGTLHRTAASKGRVTL